jgi:fucose 4-O-acetylase-like acetyltransferase
MVIIEKNFDWTKVQFSRPYWLMWFMLVMILYHLLIPFIESFDNIWLVFAASCALSLLVGFDTNIGYTMSLGRFFTFLPYFVLGMAFRRLKLDKFTDKKAFRIITAIIAVLVCIGVGFYSDGIIGRYALYGALSYEKGKYTIGIKLLLLVIGINWCFFLMWAFPNHKMPIISDIGQNTLMIYLLHGFIKLYLENYIENNGISLSLPATLAVSIIIVEVLGNKYVDGLFDRGVGCIKKLWYTDYVKA